MYEEGCDLIERLRAEIKELKTWQRYEEWATTEAENKVLKFDNKNLRNEDLRLLRRIEQLIIEKHKLKELLDKYNHQRHDQATNESEQH